MLSTIVIMLCCVWTMLSLFNGWVVRRFIFSKPPGRKMITADISAIGLLFCNLMPIVICVGVGLKTVFGIFPFSGVFLMTEALIVPYSLTVGVYNVVAVFHVILIVYPG